MLKEYIKKNGQLPEKLQCDRQCNEFSVKLRMPEA